METKERISFFAETTTVKEAKRKASIHFKRSIKPINEFNYVTSNGTYVFHRRNRIYPNGEVTLGKWN